MEDNFKDVPDQIEEITVKQIIVDQKKQQFVLIFTITPPDCNNREIIEYSALIFNHQTNSNAPEIEIQLPFSVVSKASTENLVQLEFIFFCRNELGKSPTLAKFYQLRKFVNGEFMVSGLGEQNQFNLDQFTKNNIDLNEYNYKTNTMQKFTQIPLLQEDALYFTANQSAFVINSDGKVIQWGYAIDVDENNQTIEFQSSHFLVEFPIQEYIVSIACGVNAAIALSFNGTCFSWGVNNNGQLGQCDRIDRGTPQLISTLKDKFIQQISFSYYHVLALSKQGDIYVWGKNQAIAGKEIVNSYNDCVDYENLCVDQIGPRLVSIVDKCVKISAGCNFSACITRLNKLYSWGSNFDNQLGIQFPELSQTVTHVSLPRQVNITLPVLNADCGFNHTLLIVQSKEENLQKGQLWSYGYSKQGQCGHGDLGHRLFPAPIQSLKHIQFIQISAGQNHSLALSENNELYAFGSNKDYQFGEISTDDSFFVLFFRICELEKILMPTLLNKFIPELKDKKIIEINAAHQISSFLYCK